MTTDADELHGIGGRGTLRQIARHEVGHALMLWLLEQHLTRVMVSEEGGVTQFSSVGGHSRLSPGEQLMFLLAGMVMSSNRDVLFDLREHVDTPDYFDPRTDSYYAAKMARCFNVPPGAALIRHEMVMSRLRRRFGKPYNELLNMVLEKDGHFLDARELYELEGRWDREYGFTLRPKSDLVMRAMARECGIEVPRCKWLGWDMKPLASWKYRRPTLLETVLGDMNDIGRHGNIPGEGQQ